MKRLLETVIRYWLLVQEHGGMETLHKLADLKTWQETRILRQEISQLVKKFPQKERFRLTDQLIRSSRSVTANIAEGFGRFHYKENAQYCRQARGSLSETLDHLFCAYDEKYISKEELEYFKEKINHTWKLLNGYINYLLAQEKKKYITNNQ